MLYTFYPQGHAPYIYVSISISIYLYISKYIYIYINNNNATYTTCSIFHSISLNNDWSGHTSDLVMMIWSTYICYPSPNQEWLLAYKIEIHNIQISLHNMYHKRVRVHFNQYVSCYRLVWWGTGPCYPYIFYDCFTRTGDLNTEEYG